MNSEVIFKIAKPENLNLSSSTAFNENFHTGLESTQKPHCTLFGILWPTTGPFPLTWLLMCNL
jgi:hypothetical protein